MNEWREEPTRTNPDHWPAHWPEGWLCGYIDGELTGPLLTEVEQWLRDHPETEESVMSTATIAGQVRRLDPIPLPTDRHWQDCLNAIHRACDVPPQFPPHSRWSKGRTWMVASLGAMAASVGVWAASEVIWPARAPQAEPEIAISVPGPSPALAKIDDGEIDGILQIVSADEIALISIPRCAASKLVVSFDPMGSEAIVLVKKDEISFQPLESGMTPNEVQMPDAPEDPVIIWSTKGQ